MHAVVLSLQKICTKSFTFVPKNGNKIVTIEEGTPVVLPLFGLHRKRFQTGTIWWQQ
jgi:hypothetical protein